MFRLATRSHKLAVRVVISNTNIGRYSRPFVNHEHYTLSHRQLSARVPSCAPGSPSKSTDEAAWGA